MHESIFEEFKLALVKHVEAYHLGDGSETGITHGPLQNEMQYNRVKTFFDDIEHQGWTAVTGGEVHPSSGYFIRPTIIDRPPDNSRIVVEEPFGEYLFVQTQVELGLLMMVVIGPIVPLLSWKDEKEVIERANNTNMGLGASVWSNNVAKAEKIGRQLQAGSVWINTHFDLSPMAPFGGHKESGLGTEWGMNGLKGFCNVQTLFLNKNIAA